MTVIDLNQKIFLNTLCIFFAFDAIQLMTDVLTIDTDHPKEQALG
jgi:hypothetical protein